jgi:TIR domain
MEFNVRAFLSYQTKEKLVAAEIAQILDELGVSSFMAHEDIDVSQEWQDRILDELSSADIFVAVLSQNYLSSSYCLQESGIAVFRSAEITIIPISIDTTISPGFMGYIQSKRAKPGQIDRDLLLNGIAKHDVGFVIDRLIARLSGSGTYRSAENNFRRLSPFLKRATREQNVAILRAALDNNQIAHATLCARSYLPPILRKYGKDLQDSERQELEQILQNYAEP